MSDLEKVARALCRETYEDLTDVAALDALVDKGWHAWIAAARAAVEALREPSEGMVEAAHASMVRENCGYEYSVTLGHRAMIDHVLKEG